MKGGDETGEPRGGVGCCLYRVYTYCEPFVLGHLPYISSTTKESSSRFALSACAAPPQIPAPALPRPHRRPGQTLPRARRPRPVPHCGQRLGHSREPHRRTRCRRRRGPRTTMRLLRQLRVTKVRCGQSRSRLSAALVRPRSCRPLQRAQPIRPNRPNRWTLTLRRLRSRPGRRQHRRQAGPGRSASPASPLASFSPAVAAPVKSVPPETCLGWTANLGQTSARSPRSWTPR